MKLTVLGLWHLGSVTAACCARHFDVMGLDFDAGVVAGLAAGKAPILGPGLSEFLTAGLAARRLRFTVDPAEACAGTNLLWVCYDTPVDEQDESDVAFVLERFHRCAPQLAPGTLVLISAQLPVGSCRLLEKEFPQLHFACAPENLRLGRALESFAQAARVVVGIR